MTLLPYSELIEMKRWADTGLCEAIGRHHDQLDAREAGLIALVLDHFHVVDSIFRHHLEGRPHSYRAARSDVTPPIDTLMRDIGELDDWYVAYVAQLRPKALEEPIDFAFTSGKRARMTRAQILLHVCLHGTYHRGNAGAVLQLKGLVPGRDGLTDFLEQAA